MAIEFIVEDGTGKSDATSYVETSYIDQYAENYGYSEWDTYSTPIKQAYANQATQYIDLSFDFKGSKTDEDNALEFPRDFYLIDSDEIPVTLKKAVAEVAINRGIIAERLIQSTGETLKKEKVGSLEIERFVNGTVQKTYPQVVRLLKRFGTFKLGGGSINLERS